MSGSSQPVAIISNENEVKCTVYLLLIFVCPKSLLYVLRAVSAAELGSRYISSYHPKYTLSKEKLIYPLINRKAGT